MAAETGQYDPWNAAVRSAAAAGGSWRADVRPAQSLTPGGGNEDKPQGQFARLMESGQVTPPAKTPPNAADLEGAGDESWLTLDDFIDIINPFQQLPVISAVYREFSGDEISPAARIAGGALYFWPFGAVGAAANVVLEAATGDDLGGHVMAFLGVNQDGGGGEGVQTAGAAPADKTAPAPVAISGASSGSTGAPDINSLPPEILAALQRGNGAGAVRPLEAEGFAFPAAPQKASAAYAKAGAETETQAQQAARAAEARALRRSAGEPGAQIPPPGSTAAEGGWFSAAMLQALGRYETAQDLNRRAADQQAGPAVNIEN